eukprot:GFKZ01012186.1.p2 GENE.GFKZ01012186.1~~GFKZ01012186.1.p2  ORF type:complete len:111 (-),score=2.36 GFKZ01012186.1:679-1011(-)
MRRVCASACQVEHMFKLANPSDARATAYDSDRLLYSSFTELRGVKLMDKAWWQATLLIHLRGLSFIPISYFFHDAAASSIVDATLTRVKSVAHSRPRSATLTGSRNRYDK